MKKKLLSLLLVMALTLSNFTVAFAADAISRPTDSAVINVATADGTEAYAAISAEDSVVVDLRAAEDYAQAHLKGTISIPVCQPASANYAVTTDEKDAFVDYVKSHADTFASKKIYLVCYVGTFCVDYACDWLINDCGISKDSIVRVTGGVWCKDADTSDKTLKTNCIFSDPEYAFAAADSGDGIILDVRATDVYWANGYVDGALHQPLFTYDATTGKSTVSDRTDTLAQNFNAFVEANKALLSSKDIYILCNGGASGAAAATALLANAGLYSNPLDGTVFTIEGGANAMAKDEDLAKLLVKQQYVSGTETVAVTGTSTVATPKDTTAVVIDVRAKANYDKGHLKTAISMPVFTLENGSNKVTSGYDDLAKAFLASVEENAEKLAGKDIYIVCNSGASGARAATKLLMQAGYSNSNIYTVEGGAKGTTTDMSVPNNSKFVSADQVISVLGNDDYVIFDVRAAEKYADGHLSGSISLPLFTLNESGGNVAVQAPYEDDLSKAFVKYVEDNKAELEGKTIYILCNSGETGARNATVLLEKAGLTDNVYSIEGGANLNPSLQALFTDVYRIWGQNRYETAYEIADELKDQLGVDTFDTIVVAYGKNFADALTGSYLAGVKNAPILLTDGKAANVTELVAYVKANLSENGKIYILGGTAAVAANVETALKACGEVERLAGATRIETNLAIIEEAETVIDEIIVCTANDYADSLSASAAGRPILLVKKALTDDQIAFLKANSGKHITIIGGENAVSAKLETALKEYGTIQRIGGKDRYETSVLFAEKYFINDPESAIVAYGKNYPDGLCGGPLAQAMNSPLILTAAKKEAAATSYLSGAGITKGFVLGGTAAISDDTAKTVFSVKTIADN